MFNPDDNRTNTTRDLYARLSREGFILDPREPATRKRLQIDVERIATDMDDRERPPPMLWSGVPFPSEVRRANCPFCLIVSVGGTKTGYALMRLVDGEARIVDRNGREVSGDEVVDVKRQMVVPTPTPATVQDGFAMVDRIAHSIAEALKPVQEIVQKCEAVLLSWGFAHKVVRTGRSVFGGMTARTGRMTKKQAPFAQQLQGRDIGKILQAGIEKYLHVRLPVAVANDSVMALHYFLTPENVRQYGQIGLFINGTGTNFAIAEPCAVRPAGIVSEPEEEYEPARLTPRRKLRPGETEERYFINYETGTIPLVGTRTNYDFESEHPIEENALAGGKAFEHQFREVVSRNLSPTVYDQLVRARGASRTDGDGIPRGPEISQLIAGSVESVYDVFPECGVETALAQKIHLVAQATVWRSALHAALILAAVSRRVRFGANRDSKRPDLLAVEGSVWRTPGYQLLVEQYWAQLLDDGELRVAFNHERNYNASLSGPLYLAALHREGPPANVGCPDKNG